MPSDTNVFSIDLDLIAICIRNARDDSVRLDLSAEAAFDRLCVKLCEIIQTKTEFFDDAQFAHVCKVGERHG